MPTATDEPLARRILGQADALSHLLCPHPGDVTGFDQRPTWDNRTGGGGFDNRPTWDNWNRR